VDGRASAGLPFSSGSRWRSVALPTEATAEVDHPGPVLPGQLGPVLPGGAQGRIPIMNSNFRKMLFAAAGLVVLSLPASAAGSTTVTDSGLLKANTTKQMQFAQRPYDPSAGSVGFKKSKKKKKKK